MFWSRLNSKEQSVRHHVPQMRGWEPLRDGVLTGVGRAFLAGAAVQRWGCCSQAGTGSWGRSWGRPGEGSLEGLHVAVGRGAPLLLSVAQGSWGLTVPIARGRSASSWRTWVP